MWIELLYLFYCERNILCVTLTEDVTERNTQILIEMNDCYITDLTWKTAMSSRKGLSEMRTISAAGTRYLMFKVRWSRIIMELVETTNRTGTNWMVGWRISYFENSCWVAKSWIETDPARRSSNFADDIGKDDVLIGSFVDQFAPLAILTQPDIVALERVSHTSCVRLFTIFKQ